MSQAIADIIKVDISRETQSVEQPNFGIILIVDEIDPGGSPPFTGRTKEYANLTEMSSCVF